MKINTDSPACDLLVVSPHTDDAEIGLGGTIAVLAARGRRIWALDLTRGELATNATPDERWVEADAASRALALTGRIQLELPDGFIDPHDRQQTGRVVAALRHLRPRWIATAPDPVRHPDHVATPQLVGRAVFLARLKGWQPELGPHHMWEAGDALPERSERWEAEAVFATCADSDEPTALFDVTTGWEAKLASLRAYPSQFGRGEGQSPTTINDPAFIARIERRARTWGRRAGVEFAEALRSTAVPVLGDMPAGEWR